MTLYFEDQVSVGYRLGSDPADVVAVTADRYIGSNPPVPYTFRAFSKAGILQDEDGMFDLDFRARFADAPAGSYAYAAGLVWSDAERGIDLALYGHGPVQLYMNGELLYRSTAADEVAVGRKVTIGVQFAEGWNSLFVKARCTPAGFGCRLGAEEAKVRILNVLAPFAERSGQAGWVFSEPTAADVFAEAGRGTGKGSLPDWQASEAGSPVRWLPKAAWPEPAAEQPPCERLFGVQPGKKAWAWSKLCVETHGGQDVSWQARAAGPIRVWVNGEELAAAPSGGAPEASVKLPYGKHDVFVEAGCGASGWDWALTASVGGESCGWELPAFVRGAQAAGAWLYLGPADASVELDPEIAQSMHRVFTEGRLYWQLDLPDTWVRPYYENALLSNKWTTSGLTNFARWDYPLGVTMYGLLQAGRLLGREDYLAYARKHIRACTDYYDYSLWDMEQYGFPSVNHQLVLIRMLDNCGSFGSSMLESGLAASDPAALRIAREIADFMLHRLERREDGAFYRICAGEYSENSMWADDLYMSTPFLVRYYRLTGDRAVLDEAIRQFLLFREYLFMPEQKLMSHVYDFKYGMATRVPWGRGNGWSAFSLSEVLAVVPDGHPERGNLVDFFNDLCEGYLAVQGESGLWRQVLNEPAAYEEASCTAMFVYAFARGAYNGWLRGRDSYIQAAYRGWEGLTRRAIDRHGNVHGVCSGSRYSFSPDYYIDELKTVVNDNHGIGIMLLAGVEIGKLTKWLSGAE